MSEARNMKRRHVLCLVTGVTLFAAVFVAWPRGPKEPVYKGKPITQWVDEAYDVGIFDQTEETDAAMRAFGTNAVPFLMHELTRPISSREGCFRAWFNGLSFFGIHLRTDEERVRVAGHGLMLLETNAALALPVLARYLDDPYRSAFVAAIFRSQGDAALPYLPYLTAGLASTNAVAIANVVPLLVTLASAPSPLVRQAATNQLAWLCSNTLTVLAPSPKTLRKLQTNALPTAAP